MKAFRLSVIKTGADHAPRVSLGLSIANESSGGGAVRRRNLKRTLKKTKLHF